MIGRAGHNIHIIYSVSYVLHGAAILVFFGLFQLLVRPKQVGARRQLVNVVEHPHVVHNTSSRLHVSDAIHRVDVVLLRGNLLAPPRRVQLVPRHANVKRRAVNFLDARPRPVKIGQPLRVVLPRHLLGHAAVCRKNESVTWGPNSYAGKILQGCKMEAQKQYLRGF